MEPLDSASKLWQALVQSAGLDLANYDQPLLVELASKLEVSPDDFTRELDRSGITTETLLVHVLHLITPYAAMMKEILAFFARAGAKSSAENLHICFEFESVIDSFEFDLSNFKDEVSSFIHGVAKTFVDEIDDVQALQIRHAFMSEGITYQIVDSRWTEVRPSDAVAAQWLTENETNPDTSILLPPPPTVVDAELEILLGRVWWFLNTASARITMEPEYEPALSREDVRLIVCGAYLLRTKEDVLLNQLREVFKNIQTREIETEVVFEQLIKVFNLPVWKRRSEFYSVWVGARLITSLGDRARIHAVDRSIVFSFGGAHLATLRLSSEDNLHVWCELRTKASDLIGKGRKRSIQPDYVVLREPTSHANSAALVVECKQYLRQSRKSFANALIDYANSHQRAEIVLVNYGPITPSIIGRVQEVNSTLAARTRAIGNFRPGSSIAIREFEEMVRRIACPGESEVATRVKDEVPALMLESKTIAHSGSLRLSWGMNIDLDIHCWITDESGNRQHVYYAQKLWEVGNSTVELDKDVRASGDEETLTWMISESLSLDFAVHVFSGGSDIAEAHPQLEVNALGINWKIQPPEGRQGSWWKLFRIKSAGIQIWNSVANDSPFAEP